MKISQLIAAVFAVIFAGNIITSAQTNTALPTCIDTCITINNDDSTTINIPEKRQSVGLVLSGGGAKGIAHIGVIKALEEHDIPIDFIAGTSMGAIVGGLYAIGYTPEEMVQMLLSDSFSSWSTGQIDNNLTYYFLKQPQTPAFAHLNINLNRNDSTSTQSLMAQSIISPLPMNFAFMELFAAYTAQCGGDFNKLYIPFRCVASDVINKHKIICRDGSLADAIRASMSFPAVFAPIKMNGIDVYDGGIYDNFPVDVMREEFAPDIMIGVDVHAENAPVSNSIVAQLENMIIQNNDYSLPADEGIRIHVDVSKYSLLDFGKANEIYQIGYNRAMEMMDSLQSRITTRISAPTRRLNRAVFKSATPHLRFNKVNATGGTPSQNEYLEQIFERGKNKADTFGIDKARMAYYRALTPGKLRNLMPQAKYDKSSGLFTLNLTSESKNNFSLGAGGYLTSSINSMIFVSANYSSMTFNSLTARLMGWIGQSYMAAQADARILLTNNIPSALELMAVYSRQKYYEADKLFFQDNSPAFISNYDTFARLNFAWAIGRSAKASIGIGGGQSHNEFYSNDQANFIDSTPEETKMNIGQLIGEFEFNTLDNQSYPASGTMLNVTAMQTLGKYNHITTTTNEAEPRLAKFDAEQHWFQAEASFAHYQPFGKNFSLEINANVLVSTRDLLNTYYASIVNAPAYSPFTSVQNVFNTAFHANSYAAVGIAPIWRPFQRAQVKLSGHMFMPFQRIEQDGKSTGVHYGKWFHDPQFLAQLDLVYNLPFASISGYVNYLSYPARNWSAGIAFGLYFTAEKFLR